MAPPAQIGGMTVICYTKIDSRHRHTGNTKQIVRGVLQSAAAGLAICQDGSADSFYLFGCHEDWECVTDTWHPSVDNAKDQAEFEYEGVSNTWINTAAVKP